MLKLNLGCGKNIYDGWINIDIYDDPKIYKHDLTKPFNFENNSINLIYSEHFLEHLDEVDGLNLLKNIYKILKINGTLRISIPCLDKILYTYNNWEKEKLKHNYFLKFYSKEQFLNFAFFGENSAEHKIKFINFNSTNDGHKYLYSKKDIFQKLKMIGFLNIKECERNISSEIELNNLESREEICDLIFEAQK